MASPQDSLILLTGSSGYLGNWILSTFLNAGYTIRTAVRTPSSGEKLLSIHAANASRLSYIVVPDITAEGAFNEAVKGVVGVVHTASPVIYNVEDNERDLLIPAIHGTTRILEAVAEYAPLVRRVVYTSSFAAVLDRGKGLRPGWTYTEEDWNPITYEQAKEDRQGNAYSGSKVLAEKAAWEFIAKNNVKFSLACMNPPMIYGPYFPGSAPPLDALGLSPAQIYAMMDGSCAEVPSTRVPAYVDVRDIAAAHLKAFESEVSGRFLISAGRWNPQAACDFFRERFPERRERIPRGERGSEVEACTVDAGKSRSVLGVEYRSFEETFGDMGNAFVALEKEETGK